MYYFVSLNLQLGYWKTLFSQ